LEVILWVRVQNSIGRIWSELGDDEDADAPCILPPMISFPVLYDGNVIECNGKIQTQAIESWQKELTKRRVLPVPKESLLFCIPLPTYTQDSLYAHCINEFYLHLLKMLAYFTYWYMEKIQLVA
jgi:hypothetical protein